jgi:hypothetical protein
MTKQDSILPFGKKYTLFNGTYISHQDLKVKAMVGPGLSIILGPHPLLTFLTQHFSITKVNLLMLFMEMIPVYNKNHMKPINTK